MSRTARIDRRTTETSIQLGLDLDGRGRAEVTTAVGFLDHMLTLLAKHAAIDLEVTADGDLHVDPHHTVEDVGICLGQAVRQALGDIVRRGDERFVDLFARACEQILHLCPGVEQTALGSVDGVGDRLGEGAHATIDLVRPSRKALGECIHGSAAFF